MDILGRSAVWTALMACALLLAASPVAQAQEPPSLRAAPPAEPDVLKRAPEQVLGVEASTVEAISKWAAVGTDAMTKVGESGETLRDVTLSDFPGLSGGTRNRLKNLQNAHIDILRGVSERVRNSLPFRFAPQLFQLSDAISAVADPLLVGDGRGAVSGAVDLAATSAVSSAGSATGEAVGIWIGGAVGTSVPVVGNVLGATVGGAIGGLAGGYLAAAGYDVYLKGSVVQSVEAGIAAIVDPDPLMDMIQARQQALYQKLPPEVAEMIATSQSFGGGELRLQNWEHLVATPAPDATTPPSQQQAALGDPVPTSFVIAWDAQPEHAIPCTISAQRISCTDERNQAGGHMTSSMTGTVSGSTLDVTIDAVARTIWRTTGQCPSTTEYIGHDQMVLQKGGTVVTSGSVVGKVVAQSGPCTGGPTTWTASHSNVTGKWRAN